MVDERALDSAELFDAISHPERIRILKILERQPMGFASLKRQLGIESSGNLDHHLKKLGELVAVRQDGLYGLTDAGKQALLSIDAVEVWVETENRRMRIFRKMPKEALALGLLEICGSVGLIFWFLLQVQLPPTTDSLWGFVFFGALLLAGFRSGIGVFFRLTWSWQMVLGKSAVMMSMNLFLLEYAWRGIVTQPIFVALLYVIFDAVEVAAVILALRPSLRDYLGIGNLAKPRLLAFIGSCLSISGGILLVLLEIIDRFLIRPTAINDQLLPGYVNTAFASISDTSILCGLLIIVGGFIILLGSRVLGAAISIIFGFFPTPLPLLTPAWLPQQTAHHTFELIDAIDKTSPFFFLIAGIVFAFPIVGGLLALLRVRKVTL